MTRGEAAVELASADVKDRDSHPGALPASFGGPIHDVANALTLVLGWLERAADPTDEHQAVALTRAADRARWARDELRGLLGAARPGEVADGSGDGTLDELLSRTFDDLSVEARRADVTLQSRTERGLGRAHPTAPVELWQVLTNLLLNAIQASPAGREVTVSFEAAELGMLRGRVEDGGRGVPEQLREGLFEACRTTRTGGAGYGLRNARALCREHGGDLVLARTSPSGTQFEFTWPTRLTEPTPSQRGDTRPSRARLDQLDVLLLEDDAGVTDLLVWSLSARGASVQTCASAGAFEVVLETQSWDVVLLDLSPLGATSGVAPERELARLVEAARKRSPNVVVLAMSGNSAAVLPEGVHRLRKPFAPDELVSAILEARSLGSNPSAIGKFGG